ncbi:MAG: M23 family metallopeptidase [Rikenellaceae bacterium]|nr:M23 family metallopeptidase [Rikenellaceae bacterium]
MKKLFLLLFLITVTTLHAQVGTQSLEGYYRPPMDGVLLPSGNFGEVRSGRFHAGVDIKTGGVEGWPVYATAAGYVSRISVAPGGFGKAIYINHPNGTTTVYAHLQRFTPTIERHVTEQRYRLKRHAVELYPDAQTFPVAKGDLIGYSGNTGASAGPHLHYEVRDAATQEPLNLIARGALTLRDNIAPTIVRLHYIEVDTVGIVPLKSAPRAIEVVRTAGNRYTLRDREELALPPRGYFVIEVTDRKNDSQNTMGIYRVAMTKDDEPLFGFAIDRFAFSATRYAQSMHHFEMQRSARNQFVRLALQTNNRLPVYTKMRNRGLVTPAADERRHRVEIEVWDDAGNVSTLDFFVRRAEGSVRFYTDADTEGTPVDCRRRFSATLDGLRVTIPEGALYESIFLRHERDDEPDLRSTMTLYSSVYTLHDARTPLHSAINISIPVPNLPQELRSKACLGIVSADGATISYMGGAWNNGTVAGDVSMFGRYCVVVDSTPPTVTPSFVNGADLRGRRSVTFAINDDFSGIASYEATINGEWIALDANSGRTTLTHHFDNDRIAYNGGRHTLRLTVTDNRGNATTVTREFIR